MYLADLPGQTSPAPDIAAVQRALNEWGIEPALTITDRLDADTKDALEVYQEDPEIGLPVTGEPDAATVKRLLG